MLKIPYEVVVLLIKIKMRIITLCFLLLMIHYCVGKYDKLSKMKEVFAWKQVGYDFDGVTYQKSADYKKIHGAIHYGQELDDSEKFFIQPNNVPIGFEVYKQRVFITVPRRRYGIPSTINYVTLGSSSPLLKPYPDVERSSQFVSVYRPRVDECDRLWMVDTGLLEVPGERKQVAPPAVIIYDLKTDQLILRHELDPSVIVNERTSAGLTSITVDVNPNSCDDAYAYINDLATQGLVVYSMRLNASWRLSHSSFSYDETALNFTSAGHVINWRDGIFSVALSPTNDCGSRTAYYHPLVSTNEFTVDTSVLKNNASLEDHVKQIGSRGANGQCGSHDVHASTSTMFFANVAQDGILCWNYKKALVPNDVTLVVRDSEKLGYISDLKIKGDDIWVLANQIPKFVYNTQNTSEFNYFVMKGNVRDLIKGTTCDLPITAH